MAPAAPPLELVSDGPSDAPLTLALAHGAGAPMDSPFLAGFAAALAARGWRVARFEFPYMRRRRAEGGRRPPDRAPALEACWREVAAALGTERLVVGGKSMGGRYASRVADELDARGLVCLGYPFHPPGRPERQRTSHLRNLRTPALIVQGSRDRFGRPDEVAGYDLSPRIRVVWIEEGDHSLEPPKRSARSSEECLGEAVAAVHGFLGGLV